MQELNAFTALEYPSWDWNGFRVYSACWGMERRVNISVDTRQETEYLYLYTVENEVSLPLSLLYTPLYIVIFIAISNWIMNRKWLMVMEIWEPCRAIMTRPWHLAKCPWHPVQGQPWIGALCHQLSYRKRAICMYTCTSYQCNIQVYMYCQCCSKALQMSYAF